LFDLSTQDKLFNEYITPGVTAEIATRSKLWGNIRKEWRQVEPHGRYARQKMLMAGSQAYGARSDAGYPTAQESTPGEANVYIKRAEMFTIQLDGLALEASAKGGTPMSAMEFERTGLFVGIADDLSRQLMLDGSGRLCQASALGNTSTSLVVDSPWYADATKHLKADRVIDSYKTTSIEINSTGIDSVDSITTATLKASATWTDDSYIMSEDSYTGSEGAGLGEMMGLMGIISDSDPPAPNASAGLQGLLVATYPAWKSQIHDNSGTDRELTEDLMIQVFDDVEDFATVDVILASPGVRRKYFALMKDYTINDQRRVQWGGFSGLVFDYDGRSIPVVMEKFVPDGHMLFLSMKNLVIHTLNPKLITWEKGTGAGGYLQKVAGYNRYVAEGHFFGNLATGLRPGFGLLEDITEPS
jgi:hypothetical protein